MHAQEHLEETERTSRGHATRQADDRQRSPGSAGELQSMQPTFGNAAVAGMVQRMENPAAEASSGPTASIAEGQLAEVGPGGTITYPEVDSCMTVTVHLRTGGMVGAHLSIFRMEGRHASNELVPLLKAAVGKRRVAAVEIVGDFWSWNSRWLTTTLDTLQSQLPEGTTEPPPQLQPEPNATTTVADAVHAILGHQRKKYQTRQATGNVVVRSRPPSQ
ncbi:hypothetical protein [Amycolatopsis nigrescens]|uniref:hypothetical protein n=1 Tax=Amycolatopsis nigrescens TaxID=381445 RepID=UPI000381E11C|nr:hypothetical protein [Amycolatopsis nigrescens]